MHSNNTVLDLHSSITIYVTELSHCICYVSATHS